MRTFQTILFLTMVLGLVAGQHRRMALAEMADWIQNQVQEMKMMLRDGVGEVKELIESELTEAKKEIDGSEPHDKESFATAINALSDQIVKLTHDMKQQCGGPAN